MAQVTVRINGYAYTVGCEDGQEAHLQAMAAQIEQRIDRIKALGGQSGEARLLVLASLLMADELHDQSAGRPRADTTSREEPELRRLAERAELIASTLERD